MEREQVITVLESVIGNGDPAALQWPDVMQALTAATAMLKRPGSGGPTTKTRASAAPSTTASPSASSPRATAAPTPPSPCAW